MVVDRCMRNCAAGQVPGRNLAAYQDRRRDGPKISLLATSFMSWNYIC